MLIFQEDELLFFNGIDIGFEVPPHLQCGTWQTSMKMVDEFQIFFSLFFCLMFTLRDLKTLECDSCSCMIKALSIAALKYARVIHNMHSSII